MYQSETEQIPRILHYVWVGGAEKPKTILDCIESWKKFCPDYEIIEWNETNFDVEGNAVVKEAIAQRNWALASDVIRLWAVYNHGGIYLDTDAEIIKPMDDFLKYKAFIGYENQIWLNPATFGAVPHHEFFGFCLKRYDVGGKINFSTNALTVHTYGTVAKHLYGVKQNGRKVILDNGIAILPEDYFCPQNYMTLKLKLTENSYVIHHYTSTWHSKSQRFWAGFARGARTIMGKYIFKFFERIVARKYSSTIRKEIKQIEANKKQKDAEVISTTQNDAMAEVAATLDE